MLKESLATELTREQAAIEQENQDLILESTDIKGNLALYKRDLFSSKLDEEKFRLNTETVGKLSDYKAQIDDRLDKEQEKMEHQYD